MRETRHTKLRIRYVRGQPGRIGRRHPKTDQVVTHGKKASVSIGKFADPAYPGWQT
jgi:hypothetical protein